VGDGQLFGYGKVGLILGLCGWMFRCRAGSPAACDVPPGEGGEGSDGATRVAGEHGPLLQASGGPDLDNEGDMGGHAWILLKGWMMDAIFEVVSWTVFI
jgi:hypothetical protein